MTSGGKKELTGFTEKDDLQEGLFGQITLFILELLPFLHSQGLFPSWRKAVCQSLHSSRFLSLCPHGLRRAALRHNPKYGNV